VAESDAPDGIDIVAGARYFVRADNRRCEFAVTVADGWQGMGLASRLSTTVDPDTADPRSGPYRGESSERPCAGL
jgi:hypothetical protein